MESHSRELVSEVAARKSYIGRVTDSIQERISSEEGVEECYMIALKSCDELITEFRKSRIT